MLNSWIKTGIFGLVLASALTTGAFAQDRGARVRERYQRRLAQAHRLIESLTPEQRARLEQRPRRHGRTFDAARFERRLAFRLSRPGAAARFQRRLER